MRFIIQCSVLFIIALNIISCGSDASSSKVKESEKPAATFVMKGDNKDGSNAKVTTKPNNNNRPARKTVNQASEGAFSAGPSTNSNTAKSYEGVDKFNGVPNACTLISIKEIASIFGMKAEAITRKDASHTKSPFTRSCFFKWDGASPNTGILLQVQANPVAEEYAEWVSLYVESKRTSGEKEMEEMVDRVRSIAYYDILFEKAFGEDEITEDNMLSAISKFVNAISSNESKFDEGLSQTFNVEEPFANFTTQENLGKELFNSNCSSCHGAQHDFTIKAVANNGLDLEYADNGKGAKTGNPFDMGVFKVPFLRNIELSGPYMHDGRFASLEEVVNFYSDGIKTHSNLNTLLKDNSGQAKKMNFAEIEKAALVSYLETLTDEEMIKDDKFADPFGE